MNLPNDRTYIESHEWLLELGGGRYRVGLTDFAQQALGDIVFIDLPGVGDRLTAGGRLGDVESVKAVSEIESPASGRVVAVNEELAAAPERVNADPYGAWLVELEDVTDKADLLDAEGYRACCERA